MALLKLSELLPNQWQLWHFALTTAGGMQVHGSQAAKAKRSKDCLKRSDATTSGIKRPPVITKNSNISSGRTRGDAAHSQFPRPIKKSKRATWLGCGLPPSLLHGHHFTLHQTELFHRRPCSLLFVWLLRPIGPSLNNALQAHSMAAACCLRSVGRSDDQVPSSRALSMLAKRWRKSASGPLVAVAHCCRCCQASS